MKYSIKIGIIGGTGLENSDIMSDRVVTRVDTDFGLPSDVLVEGSISGVPCILLARHGRCHSIMPTNINFRANISALKQLGCTHVLVSTACGSLKEEICPGDLVIFDSFVDRTQKRSLTFFDGTSALYPGICHLPMEPAFCNDTRKILISCAKKLNLKHHGFGTCVTIEGPRFSTKAESKLFKSWGCDVVNMTTVPEVILAKEAGLCYAAIGMVTDYDSWRDNGNSVTVTDVMTSFRENAKKVTQLMKSAIYEIGKLDWDDVIEANKDLIKNNTV